MEKLWETTLSIMGGAGVTLEIFCVTLLLSLPLGLLAAMARLSSVRPLGRLMELYIWIMRGSPLMLQLLFVYFALPRILRKSSGRGSSPLSAVSMKRPVRWA